ncbi:5'-methylthioadenosine/S-adenosylhomocysteine nucleosidase [Sporolactobacillus spathodeae]|uniref:5'-methylthioadenosine/S-adenosylhomocysteine nucleosidase n=1 Tax=Sporolactobacillus spathodeae TaxID=1465502 RepID=A0ABS2Q7V1_9BACL|nr:5'-methylthioadenosine/S-adenosylhomocysteine nucleosidase [Sporolactobacillus spathodeae]MBM7657380.1 adenosylhomocysteine nucleosidase [Sporolactobacillus spathodeae]
MRLGLIGAMEEEIAILKERLEDRTETEVAGCHFYSGKLEGMDVVLLQSGIGKVNAAIGTALLIDRFQPDLVINTGSSGGTDQSLAIGDVVISNKVFHHDVDATAFNYVPGQVPGMPAFYQPDPKLAAMAAAIATDLSEGHRIIQGAIGTGDSFMSDRKRIEALSALFPDMVTVEMEAAAIAQTCYRFNIPFLIVRSLSDIAGKASEISFEKFLEQAAVHSAQFVIALVKTIKEQ